MVGVEYLWAVRNSVHNLQPKRFLLYQRVEKLSLPFVPKTFRGILPWEFQHDNASIRTAVETRRWHTGKHIRTLLWPAKSPDLNIFEDFWDFMVRHFHKRRKQYSNMVVLKQSIRDAREAVDSDYIFRLYNSIPRHVLAVMDNNGKGQCSTAGRACPPSSRVVLQNVENLFKFRESSR